MVPWSAGATLRQAVIVPLAAYRMFESSIIYSGIHDV